ncbi:MAG TPA: hypothetical protein DCE41_12100 [Cytophagales bacterium]|nr:hypothetical protein [Cytophagales bacterium]HAA21720.1 hypothetical protein [Cytophagales bacterium]HAP61151.1 hypothetical protein [Cytophagales bacterium]
MNWRVNPLRSAVLLPALIGFAACQTLSDIDSPVGPDRDLIGVNYVELSLPTELVMVDSFTTTNTGRLLVGNFRDAELGSVQATSYVRMALETPDPVVKADATVDSLVIFWEVNYVAAQQEVTTNQTFSVYLIDEQENIENSVLYYSGSSLNKGELVGSNTISVDRTKEDTVYSLRLDNTWGEELLANMISQDPVFKNTTEFNEVYKGLVLESDVSNDVVVGINNSTETDSRLALYFSSPGDTVSKRYDILFSGNSIRGFHQLEFQNDGSAVGSLTDSYTPIDGGGRVLAMAGVGFGTLLDLDYFRNYFDTIPPNLINYADILMSDVEETDEGNTLENIRFYITGNDGRFIPGIYPDSALSNINPPKGIYDPLNPQIPTQAGEVVYFQPQFDSAAVSFNGPITPFLQLVADSTIVEPKLLLLPLAVGASLQTLKLDEADFKLRIYFTNPNE